MRRRKAAPALHRSVLDELFPESGRVLLTGTGVQFVERLGQEAIRHAILSVMLGHNIRSQTEPLSRRRIAQVSGALVSMFARGYFSQKGFEAKLSELAVSQLRSVRGNDNARIWLAQWLIGLTGKAWQNVLRSNPEELEQYLVDFEAAIEESARKCADELGDYRMTLSFIENGANASVDLDWKGITRLTTAIGSQTLTIRGSDKSLYGKIFERLILGSVLTILGFRRVEKNTGRGAGEFWLSDSSDIRESDATLRVSDGRFARFDIGFIGPGNSEISKDKLSRYAREFELANGTNTSVTFIVVDRLPRTGKTERAAKDIAAEIVQMSLNHWPRDLARRLGERLGVKHELQDVKDGEMGEYLRTRLAKVPVIDFVSGVSLDAAAAEESDEGE